MDTDIIEPDDPDLVELRASLHGMRERQFHKWSREGQAQERAERWAFRQDERARKAAAAPVPAERSPA